jgi:D-sedoheptulose 7-phosphate isomerase
MKKNIQKEIKASIQIHKRMIADLEASGIETIAAMAEAIIKSLKQSGRVYICGNGGSAADAQHIAGEIVGRFQKERRALPAVALSTDTSVITAIANDCGYENIFVRQVEAFVKKGDILWAISTSGNSPNIIAAVKTAKKKQAKVIAFTGRAKSKLEKLADICLCANSGAACHSQQIHQIAYHIICNIIECAFAKK